jgi:ribosomal protein S18 acetylase RimI-like enzyme
MDQARAAAVYRNYCSMWRQVGALAIPGDIFEVIERPDMLLIRSNYAHRVPHMVLEPRVCADQIAAWSANLVQDIATGPSSLMVGIEPGEEHGSLVAALRHEGFMRAARPSVAMTRAILATTSIAADAGISLARTEADLDVARNLLARIFGLPAAVFAFYTPPGVVHTYLLREAGLPVAAGCLFPADDAGGIYSVGVVPSMRGRGYARRLVQHLLADAAALGLSAAVLSCEQSLVGLYERLGFEVCWELVSYWLEAWWR